MKQSNMKRVAMASVFATTLCASMMMGMPVQATQLEPSEEGVPQPIEYVYTNEAPTGIHLNGNSVVIRQSDQAGNSFNIYIDENKNGIVDDNETLATIETSESTVEEEFAAGLDIYGVKDIDAKDAVAITIESGVIGRIYGVYNGSITTAEDVALKIAMKGGICTGGLYGAYESDVTAGKVAIDIDVTGDAVVEHNFYVVQGLDGDQPDNIFTIKGNIDVDWNTDNLADAGDALANFCGVKNNVDVEGTVDLYMNNIHTATLTGLRNNVKVTGDYVQKCEPTSLVPQGHWGMEDSTVLGDASITLHGGENLDNKLSSLYGIHGYCNRSDVIAVGGKATIIYTGGYVGNLYAIHANGPQNNPLVKGDVVVDVQSGYADYLDLVRNMTVHGSLTVDVREGFEVNGRYSCFAGGHVEKDVIMDLHNAYENTEVAQDDFSALRDMNVAGDVTIVVDGGNYDEVRAIYGSESSVPSRYIGGKLDLTVKNVDARLMRMVYYGAIVRDDVKIAVDNITTGEFVGVLDSEITENFEMTIKNSTLGYDNITDTYSANNSYLFGRTLLGKGAKVDINNTATTNECGFGVAFGEPEGSGEVDLICRNVQFENVSHGVATPIDLSYKIYVDAKVGETSTKDKPLTKVFGLGRTLSYLPNSTVIADGALPEGLVFEDGKIYGTPTKAYPNGVNVDFVVANDNDSVPMTICFNVAKKDCEFDAKWSSDEKYHWQACTHTCGDENCDATKDKAEHTWDDGVVTKEATTTEKGTKTYTCPVCKATKTEDIPVKETTQEDKKDDAVEDTPGDTSGDSAGNNETIVPANKGDVLKDNDKNAIYTVTNSSASSPEVSYKLDNKKVKKVVIPKTITVDGVTYKVTSVQSGAFKNHKNLKEVTIGTNVKSIGKNAFSGCKKLTTVKMGKNVTSIGENAFYNCIALKKIEIPAKVNKIGTKAFYNCKKLTNITIKTTKLTTKNVGKKAFTKAGSNNYKELIVKVPKSKLTTYKKMLKKSGLSDKAKVTK